MVLGRWNCHFTGSFITAVHLIIDLFVLLSLQVIVGIVFIYMHNFESDLRAQTNWTQSSVRCEVNQLSHNLCCGFIRFYFGIFHNITVWNDIFEVVLNIISIKITIVNGSVPKSFVFLRVLQLLLNINGNWQCFDISTIRIYIMPFH